MVRQRYQKQHRDGVRRAAGHENVKTRPLLWSFRSDDKNRRDERWDHFADLDKLVAKNDDGRRINPGTHCSHSSTTSYAPSHHGHKINSLIPLAMMTTLYEVKQQQLSEAAKFRDGYPDPIGLTPKTVILTD
jgi:hypothetical protein